MANGIKTGGRRAGTPNKATAAIKEVLADIVSTELETIKETLANLPPQERIQALIKLLPYVVPKQVELNGQGLQNDIVITLDLSQPKETLPVGIEAA